MLQDCKINKQHGDAVWIVAALRLQDPPFDPELRLLYGVPLGSLAFVLGFRLLKHAGWTAPIKKWAKEKFKAMLIVFFDIKAVKKKKNFSGQNRL